LTQIFFFTCSKFKSFSIFEIYSHLLVGLFKFNWREFPFFLTVHGLMEKLPSFFFVGSGIRDGKKSGSGTQDRKIPDPGWGGKIPGSGINILDPC
jgi:hypothetical protein